MSAPDVILVKRSSWNSNDGKPFVHEVFEVRGGDIDPEWARCLRAPRAPWCRITIWNMTPDVTGYGGEVWPSAWPEMFRIEGPNGRQATMLTDVGIAAFEAARAAWQASP